MYKYKVLLASVLIIAGCFLSFQEIKAVSGICYFCCCTDGSWNSGEGISCYESCLGHGGIQSSQTYDCFNPPATPPNCVSGDDYVPPSGDDYAPGGPIGSARMPNWLGTDSISGLIANIANFLIQYIAIPLAVFMMILAGFRFVTAQGNEEKINVAKKNFVWTAVGIGIVLASNMIIIYIQELLGGSQGNTLVNFINRIKGTLNLVIGMLFALVTVYFIWGIIQYVTSGGDEQKLAQGKKHMVWGIVGMTIMGAAWGIVAMIGAYVTGQ